MIKLKRWMQSDRKYFTAIAMQGLQLNLSNREMAKNICELAEARGISVEQYIARMAVKQADAIIEALNRKGGRN